MVGQNLGPDRDHVIRIDAKLGELHLGLDLRDGKALALGLRNVLHLGLADPDLQRTVAVHLGRAMRHDLATVEFQHRDRHMFARFRENTGHSDLLGDDT